MTKLEAFLAKQDKIIAEDREKTLIALGLTDKEYAPDNVSTYRYNEYEYRNGEKLYYRTVAMQLTDEEYQLVLQKMHLVADIEARRSAEAQRQRGTVRVVQRWLPEFRKPQPEPLPSSPPAQPDSGRSRIATGLRCIAWIGFAGLLITCIFLLLTSLVVGDAIPGGLLTGLLGGAAIELMLFLALAEILDSLAEMTAIARHGYRYSEGAEHRSSTSPHRGA